MKSNANVAMCTIVREVEAINVLLLILYTIIVTMCSFVHDVGKNTA